MATLATKRNMQKYNDISNAVAWSPLTGEEYSADPNDYFMRTDPDKPLLDEEGQAMYLIVKVTSRWHNDGGYAINHRWL